MNIIRDDKKILEMEEKNGTIVVLVAIVITFALVRTAFIIYTFGLAEGQYLHWIFVAILVGLAGKDFTKEVNVTFNRHTKVMRWQRKKYFKEQARGTLSFSDIEDVRLGYEGKGKRMRYRTELVVKGAPFPLSHLYFQGEKTKNHCDRIGQRILEIIATP